MTTTTQPWLRAELIAGPETTPGAQLMIPADGVEFHDDQLVFHHQGEIVYVADQGQLRSITWFAKQPNPETARRKAIWPNHGTRWTDDQRADLLRRLQLGQNWPTISTAAGRSRTGCQQEAIKQGWLDPETLRPRPGLFAALPSPVQPDAQDAPAAATTSPEQEQQQQPKSPDQKPGDASQPHVASAADSASSQVAATAQAPTADPVPVPSSAPHPTDATDSPSSGPATASPAPTAESASTLTPVDPVTGPSATTSADTPASAVLTGPTTADVSAPALLTSGLADSPTDCPNHPARELSPSEALAALLQGADTDSSLYFDTAPSASAVPRSASEGEPTPPPQPDTPPSGPHSPRPRIPRQRTDSDPDPGKDGPGPANRFLSRGQSSLSRATLSAYLNPSKGQPSGTP